jgi:hypothetical protein
MAERRAVTEWQVNIEGRVDALDKKIDANTDLTHETKAKVDEVHETLIAIKGALKVFAWIATALKYVGYVAAAVVAIVSAWKLGDTTKIDIPK